MSGQINFTKKATPQHIGFHQTSTITYTLSNLTALFIDSAVIFDSLITISSLDITGYYNCELNRSNSTVTMLLPKTGLAKSDKTSCSIQLHTTGTTPPSDTIYSTTATITAAMRGTPVTVLTEDAVGKFTINSAYITVSDSRLFASKAQIINISTLKIPKKLKHHIYCPRSCHLVTNFFLSRIANSSATLIYTGIAVSL